MGGRGLPIGPPGAGFSTIGRDLVSRDLVSVLPVPDREPFLAKASSVATARAIAATSIGRTRLVMAKHLSTFINCPLLRSQHDAACRKIADLARNEIRRDRSAVLSGPRPTIGGCEPPKRHEVLIP